MKYIYWKKSYSRSKNIVKPLTNRHNSSGKKNICDVLRDLVPFVQLKEREKHPWKSVIFN